MQIGNFQLSSQLIQAPLAGISCAPFRALFSLYEKPAYAVTEMISAHSILNHSNLNPRYLAHDNQEGPWCIQLSGQDPSLIYDATQIATSYAPDLIDLNCGCPKPKIRAKGCGSALINMPEKLEAVMLAMRKATHLPLTAKIRVAGNTEDNAYLEAATIIEACGVDAIIVHGRHYSEKYDVEANYHQIRAIVERVKIPVIANGDVSDTHSMQTCLGMSGAAAIMVGRASIGKPWIFQNLLGDKKIPVRAEIFKLFQVHIDALAELERSNQVALFQGRRLLKWYFPDLDSNQLASCYRIQDLNNLYIKLAAYYD
ncbi:MAG: tRNA-dihydrouridine synthase [Gammaproteobacteria bacterium]|nr:tRNA-dihydrouridine synthase [Gammaproteobacteria bacterium]MCH9763370.1 tRNA-dihydrouridine synthase [Gammaproteobacteria bacterium]